MVVFDRGLHSRVAIGGRIGDIEADCHVDLHLASAVEIMLELSN